MLARWPSLMIEAFLEFSGFVFYWIIFLSNIDVMFLLGIVIYSLGSMGLSLILGGLFDWIPFCFFFLPSIDLSRFFFLGLFRVATFSGSWPYDKATSLRPDA